MSDESKKDIAAHYAYRTVWACMRVPVVLRLPIALVGAVGCACKMVESTIEQRRHEKSRVVVTVSADADPFSAAFGDE